MTQPVQPASWLPAAFCASTAALLTGCSLEATGAGVGAGLVVGIGAWAGYRYLSRLRGPVSNPKPPAVVLSTPTPASSPDPEPTAAPPPDFQAKVAQWEKRLLDLSVPADKAAPVLDILYRRGLTHANEEIARASASLLEKVLSERPELVTPELARIEKLVTPAVVERLIALGLRSGRGPSLARSALDALKTVALFSPDATVAREAFDALSIDGLQHEEDWIATSVAQKITEIADKDHARVSLLPLVTLRQGLGWKDPIERKLAFLEAIAHIAAPEPSEPGPNRRVSEKALEILFQDALPLSDPEIAGAARRHLVAVYRRRPDLFSQGMRETLATL
ncbi:MAG TPA: hypothetical protein VFX30_10165 [bacterium]|nr:hypothetical protein [bacterium]